MANPPFKRKQMLVDAQLQVGLSVRLVAWLYVYLVLFLIAANAPAIFSLVTADVGSVSYSAAVNQLTNMTGVMVLPLACTFVSMAVHAVLFTHRVAGPVYRFKQVVRDIARQRPPAVVRLRDGDYMQDLAAEFNVALQVMRDNVARERRMNGETLDAAQRLVDRLEQQGSDDAGAELARTIADAAERLDRHLAALEPEVAPPAEEPPAEDAPKADVEVVHADTQDIGEPIEAVAAE